MAPSGLATHREDSEVEDYLGGSPKYDDDEDEGFITAGGFETDRASQASGHGGRVLFGNDKRNPVEPLLVGRQARPCVGMLDLRSVSSGGPTDQRPNDYVNEQNNDHHQDRYQQNWHQTIISDENVGMLHGRSSVRELRDSFGGGVTTSADEDADETHSGGLQGTYNGTVFCGSIPSGVPHGERANRAALQFIPSGMVEGDPVSATRYGPQGELFSDDDGSQGQPTTGISIGQNPVPPWMRDDNPTEPMPSDFFGDGGGVTSTDDNADNGAGPTNWDPRRQGHFTQRPPCPVEAQSFLGSNARH